ncbi:hypothetical protein T484DRAFT_3337351 [Baffinella frigidus]|nr:hypothetical protein T484DRAFT_3337351 [Cryptophyta sp. CCMP2293]
MPRALGPYGRPRGVTFSCNRGTPVAPHPPLEKALLLRPQRTWCGATLHPAPCTPAPCTLHPCTLHPAPLPLQDESLALEGVPRALESVIRLLLPALFWPVGLHAVMPVEPGNTCRV